jgi:hypothetical protein
MMCINKYEIFSIRDGRPAENNGTSRMSELDNVVVTYKIRSAEPFMWFGYLRQNSVCSRATRNSIQGTKDE